MNSLNDTKLNPTTRLELIVNRLEYLNREILKLTQEKETFEQEQKLLTELQELYQLNGKDTIDLGRRRINTRTKAKSANTTYNIIIGLLETGPATIKALAEVSGIDKKVVATACSQLYRGNRISKIGTGHYAKYEGNQIYKDEEGINNDGKDQEEGGREDGSSQLRGDVYVHGIRLPSDQGSVYERID